MTKVLTLPPRPLVNGVAKDRSREYLFLTIMMLAFSGNPAIYCQSFIDAILVGFAVFLAILMLRRSIEIVTAKLTLIACLFGIIILVQCVSFSFYPVVTICGFYTRLFIGYAILQMVKNFPLVCVRAMCVLAVLSLTFYVPREISHFMGFDLAEWFSPLANIIDSSGSSRYKLILHTYILKPTHLHRNCGMFWEPGAFAGYLIIAMMFLAIVRKEISKREYIRCLIILSVVLFTTLSTTGYIIYPLVLLLHYDWKFRGRRNIAKRILLFECIILPLLIGGSAYFFSKAEFLQAKITHQLDEAKYQDTTYWYKGRIGTLVFDWKYIKRRPLTGWGMHDETRYALDPELVQELHGTGNGMSGFIVQFGISGMLIWFFCVFQNMRQLTRQTLWKNLYIMMIFLLILQGEYFLNFPLFLGLMCLGKHRKLNTSW